MGSGMAMEADAYRPRPNKAEWHGEELYIFKDRFYHGYKLLWKGPVTPDNESLIRLWLPNGIPPKPEPLPNRYDLLYDILNRCADIDAVGEEAIEIALDTTRDFVVQWLQHEGDTHAAEVVEEILSE